LIKDNKSIEIIVLENHLIRVLNLIFSTPFSNIVAAMLSFVCISFELTLYLSIDMCYFDDCSVWNADHIYYNS